MLKHCCVDLLSFSLKSISEVGHRCWEIRPGSQSAFQFIVKVFDVVEVRALCRPVKFFHMISTNHFCMDLTLCTGGIAMLNQEMAFLKLFITPENMFPLLQSPMAVSFTPL